MDLTRPPSNSFRALTQRSPLVPVLQIPLSPLWILSPREVRHTEDLWIEASTTGHVTWQSATLDLGWTLRAMAVVHDHKRRMAFKLAPSRTYISSDAWTPFVIPLLSLSRSLSVAFSPGVIASVPLRLESYFAVSGNPQLQRFHLVDPLRDPVLYSSPTTGWKCCCEALTDQRILQGSESSPLPLSRWSPTSLFLAALNDSVFIWLTPSAILFSTRRQQQGGNAAARR